MKARVSFAKKNHDGIEISLGANLMASLLEAGIPVASSCHGDGVCGKCRVLVVSGAENLSAANETELFLREQHQIKKDFRVSCQTQVLGNVCIDATYW